MPNITDALIPLSPIRIVNFSNGRQVVFHILTIHTMPTRRVQPELFLILLPISKFLSVPYHPDLQLWRFGDATAFLFLYELC